MSRVLTITSGSRCLATVRSKGVLGALKHELTFAAPLTALSLSLDPNSLDNTLGIALDISIDVSLDANLFEPLGEHSASSRAIMLSNIRGPEVLDVARHPHVRFDGHYVGDETGGELCGAFFVRGQRSDVTLNVQSVTSGKLHADFEGRLTSLGLRPYRALFGASALDDWIRIAIEILLADEAT